MRRSLVDHWQENSVCIHKVGQSGIWVWVGENGCRIPPLVLSGFRFPSSRAAAVSFASRHVVATTYQERKWRGRESKDEAGRLSRRSKSLLS